MQKPLVITTIALALFIFTGCNPESGDNLDNDLQHLTYDGNDEGELLDGTPMDQREQDAQIYRAYGTFISKHTRDVQKLNDLLGEEGEVSHEVSEHLQKMSKDVDQQLDEKIPNSLQPLHDILAVQITEISSMQESVEDCLNAGVDASCSSAELHYENLRTDANRLENTFEQADFHRAP
ncbi:hypothetical protein B0H94_103199 [Salsuginibacillus halophilus]|uniref:Cell-wall binding lipoprotein n=1 Tax=Salsuginibacillus halophilus TaxID=517424 RepID=A0A2P8HWH3_9BACI|nr:hypothetical protein [Salsuginibacillus halophilus]PSL50586.1 hypothetical protein B0H94_103199 [Salsuginibacillus halophilus]